MDNYETLIISGGGMKAISAIGTIKYFEESNILKNFKSYIGVSAGSALTYLITIGYSSDELIEIITKIQPNDLIKHSVEDFFTTFGVFNIVDIIELIESIAKQKDETLKITFKEHYRKHKKILKIIGTNLTDAKTEVFSYKTTPDMTLYKALSISMAVPYLFCPITHNNKLYCDGGVTCNVPFKYSKNIKKTLAIIYRITEQLICDNIFKFSYALLAVVSNDIKMYRKYRYNCLNLYLDRYSTFNFDQTEKHKINLIKLNYMLTKHYAKSKNLLKKYFYLLRKNCTIESKSLSPV